jgi:hypothetical protein
VEDSYAALYIVLEKEIPGLELCVDGKALSRSEKQLDRLAKRLRVTPLMDFFSANADELTNFLEGEFEAAEGSAHSIPEVSPERWFDARDGLATVRALREHLGEHPDAVQNCERVLSDLGDFTKVLERAASAGVRWHLAVDF